MKLIKSFDRIGIAFVGAGMPHPVPALIEWYFKAFIPDPDRGYALMTPLGGVHKYARRNQPLTIELVTQALKGSTRRLKVEGVWQSIPLSIAVTPEHRDGWAFASVVEVDEGGEAAVKRVFTVCSQHGLWAFAQASKSQEHDGGHIYIPVSERVTTSLLRSLSIRIQAEAQVKGEPYPNNRDLRLPFMPHLRAPGGARNFDVLLQSGERINTSYSIEGISSLYTSFNSNSIDMLSQAFSKLPFPTPQSLRPFYNCNVSPHNSTSVINWFNNRFTITELLRSIGVLGADQPGVVACPWHEDKSPSLVIWHHRRKNILVCRCYSQHSNCRAAGVPFLDAFNLFCLVHNLTPSEAVSRLAKEYNWGRRDLKSTKA